MHRRDGFAYSRMLKKFIKALGVAAGFAALLENSACAEAPMRSRPVSVDVRVNADDGLSQRFGAALEAAFRRSGSFVWAKNGEPVDLVVTVPSNLEVNVGRAAFVVEFSGSGNQALGATKGSCLESNLTQCVDQVLRDAGIAVHRTAPLSGPKSPQSH